MDTLSSSTELKIQVVKLPFDSDFLLRQGIAIKDIVLFKAVKKTNSSHGKTKNSVIEESQGFASIKTLKESIKTGALPHSMIFFVGTPKIREFIRMFGTALFAEHTADLVFAKGSYKNAPDATCIKPTDEMNRIHAEDFGSFVKASDKKDSYFAGINWFDMYQSNPDVYMELIANHLIFADFSSHTFQLMKNASIINFSLWDSGTRIKSGFYRDFESIFSKLAASGNIILSLGKHSTPTEKTLQHSDFYKTISSKYGFDSTYNGSCYIAFTDEQFALIQREFEGGFTSFRSVHDEKSKIKAPSPNNRDEIYMAAFKADVFGIKQNAHYPDDYYGFVDEDSNETDDE